MTDTLQAARAAYARRDWAGARAAYAAARGQQDPLTGDDLYADGDAAWWLGQPDESSRANEAAYQSYLAERRPGLAAKAALTVGINHLMLGNLTVGSAWLSRAQRLVADDPACVEHWLLRYVVDVELPLEGVATLDEAGAEAVVATARGIRSAGHRLGEPALVVCGLTGEGRALVKRGRVREGLPLLDEALISLVSEDVALELSGDVYCHLMAAAHELADLRRARDWTRATTRWLETLPAAALFTGICRVHRSQVHQTTGDWDRAEREATRVGEDLVGIQPSTAAEAWYQVGEIRRLRGDQAGASAAYQRAHELGRDPQPGIALLHLAQGRPEVAAGSVRAALAAAGDRLARARLCAAQVEIAVAGEDLATARKASEELTETAVAFGSSGLAIMASQARGALLLAEGHPAEALPVLRESCQRWTELEAPYDCARVRVLLARAYEAMGDPDAATRERSAAGSVFARLGAEPELRALVVAAGRPERPDGLTDREVEVLTLVAAGRSNRQVAAALVVSEKTVARHLSNIFTKIGVSSRTEAAAYAYTHGLTTAGRG